MALTRNLYTSKTILLWDPRDVFFSLRVANALITFSLNSAAGAPVIPVRWTVCNAQVLPGALLSGLPRFTLFFSFVLFCCSGAHRAPRAPPGGRVAVYSAPRGLVTRYSHLGSQGPKSPSEIPLRVNGRAMRKMKKGHLYTDWDDSFSSNNQI